MKKTLPFDFTIIPSSWALCFNADCRQKDVCMRHFAGENVPSGRTDGIAIYPNSVQNGRCEHFLAKRIINAAWGFNTLFNNVRIHDGAPIRAAIKRFLGGHGTYYKYMHGRKTLTPEQQTWILNLFRSYGYTENLTFDHYAERYDL